MDPLESLRIVPGINLLAGIAIAAVCGPLIKGKVAPNRFYGIRIPLAFTSEENWYRVNRYGGKILYRVGVFVALLGLLGLFLPASLLIIYSIVSAILILGTVTVASLYIWVSAASAS